MKISTFVMSILSVFYLNVQGQTASEVAALRRSPESMIQLSAKVNGARMKFKYGTESGNSKYVNVDYQNCKIVLGDDAELLRERDRQEIVKCDLDVDLGYAHGKLIAYLDGDDVHFSVVTKALKSNELELDFRATATFDKSKNKLSASGAIKGWYIQKIGGVEAKIAIKEALKI